MLGTAIVRPSLASLRVQVSPEGACTHRVYTSASSSPYIGTLGEPSAKHKTLHKSLAQHFFCRLQAAGLFVVVVVVVVVVIISRLCFW